MLEPDGFTGRSLLAIGLIVLVAAGAGALARKLGQPRVVGQLAAGFALGPTLLERMVTPAWHWLFDVDVVAFVDEFAQLAVALFAFGVGLALSVEHTRAARGGVVALGCAAFLVPGALGVGVALIWSDARPPGTAVGAYAGFVGVALGVTAFPVLAHILREHGVATDQLGVLGLATAGVVDVLAWLALGGVVAAARDGGLGPFGLRVGLATAFGLLMGFGVRPIVHRVFAKGMPVAPMLAIALVCGAATDLLGLHAIFGALAAGLIMPRGVGLQSVDGFTTHVGLPAFFAALGLHTDLRPLLGASGVALTLAVIGCAVTGKFAGTTVTALALGFGRFDAVALGTMMNCRGLTELVVLSVGHSLGLIGADMFGALVVMALVTTAVTGPLLSRLGVVGVDNKPDRGHGVKESVS
ncbi:cation:proton antiporter [Nocardia sp. NPDC052566]|uniref:cation:proton antiporter n=1 Tax=Nocardia sp. NPDC052566 TaxID=3364330 RepID=UPI0037C96FB7